MLIAAGVFSLLIWGYLLLARGQFWRVPSAAAPLKAGPLPAQVAVIIPARDEADVVGSAVTSLLRQTGNNAIHIYLVDDGSSDGTAQAARAAAGSAGRAEMLTLIEGRPLPPGWAGKLWAVHQGVERARLAGPEFLLLTDADILHAPESIATLVTMARSGPFDLASFMVKLHCETVAEKLLVPAFVFFFFKLYPPAWVADPRRSTAGAAGGCILIRAAALRAAGGLEAIRNQMIDDCALAARVKHNGGRLWLGVSATTRSLRPYGGFFEIGKMISRSAFNQLHHSSWLLALALVGMAATYLLPPALVLQGRGHLTGPVLLGAGVWLLMTLSLVPTLRLYRLSPLWALALPLIAIFYMGATFHSAWKYWSGRGGEWKGRIQDPRGEQR